MAAHRFWRVHITGSTSGADNLISLYEARMAGTVGGPDLCTGGTATASHASGDAGKLFDDSTGTYWINGGPGVDTWFQYEFTGGDVAIAELAMLPRYAYQSPKDFTLQYSDDGVIWQEEGSWSGVTDWTGGVEKLFVPPAPPGIPVAAQNQHSFSIALAQAMVWRYDLALWVRVQRLDRFGLRAARSRAGGYAVRLEVGHAQGFVGRLSKTLSRVYGLALSVPHGRTWKRFLERALHQPLHATVGRFFNTTWSMRWPVSVQNLQPVVATQLVVADRQGVWWLQPRNPVAARMRGFWELATALERLWDAPPVITVNGVCMALAAVSVSHDAEKPHWQAHLTLLGETDFQRFGVDDPFLLSFNGETFALIVDRKEMTRDGEGRAERTLTGVSPIEKKGWPRAERITRDWAQPVQARAVVEALLGVAVDWQLPLWRIEAGRLAIRALTPLAAARRIAAAAGGVLEGRADGGFRARHLFPVPLSDWDGASPDHRFTDAADILKISEVGRAGRQINRITVWDQDPQAGGGFLRVSPDQRIDGPNRGRTAFPAGDPAYLLVTAGPGVAVTGLESSSGTLAANAPSRFQVVEDVVFSAASQAMLSQPVAQMDSVTWLGRSLGDPTLAADHQTLTTPESGTALARVTATVAAFSHQLQVAGGAGDGGVFPVQVTAAGLVDTDAGVRRLTLQRQEADQPEAEVMDPILSDYQALQSRAQAELDGGAPLLEVSLTIRYRNGVEPGQLVEVQDGGYGQVFRGQVIAVSHESAADGLLSTLTILKQAG